MIGAMEGFMWLRVNLKHGAHPTLTPAPSAVKLPHFHRFALVTLPNCLSPDEAEARFCGVRELAPAFLYPNALP